MTRLEALQAQLDELLTVRNADHGEFLALADQDEDLNDAQQARWDDLTARFDPTGRWAQDDEVDVLTGQVERLTAIRNAPPAAQERVSLTLHTPDKSDALARGVEWEAPDKVVDTARRALDKDIVELDDKYRAAAHRCLSTVHGSRDQLARHIIATGRQAYRSAFGKVMDALARGMAYPLGLTQAEAEALDQARAASLTDAAGGYAVPFTLDPTIILTGAHDGEGSVWRQLCTVKQTVTDTWNGVSSAGVTAHWYGEGAEVSDDSPTLAQPSITPKKAAAFVPFSVEIEGDWASMEADFRMMFMIARDDLESAAFSSAVVVASGPDGLIFGLDGTASEITPTTPEAFAVDDIYKTANAVARRHRRNASWMADYATFNTIRGFDTGGGADLWVQLAADVPPTLIGKAAYEEPGMRSTADINVGVTADNFILLFGDFSRYYIVDRVGMSVELVPHLFHTGGNRPSLQRGLVAWWRTGAKVIDTGAFAVLNVATTA